MPKALVNDVRLYYEIEGEGEPLALVGGGLFGRQNWAMVIDELKSNFRVLSYDQRGYGESDRPIQGYSMELWADDLVALLDIIGIRKTHVAGTSMGAMVALKFAAQYPERTMAVVADCAFAKPDRRRKMILETWRRLAQTVGVSDIFADHVFTQAVGDDFLDSAKANQAIAMNRRIVGMNAVETVVQACLAMENLDLTKDLRKIKAPTLIMNAPGDLITPLDMGPTGVGGRKMHEMIRGSKLKIWRDIGHADLLEKPQESARTIIRFLNSANVSRKK